MVEVAKSPPTAEQQAAFELLDKAGIFYGYSERAPRNARNINLNDAFYWGCADCEEVAWAEMEEVGDLFERYGWCGVCYWVCKKRDDCSVEFLDVNRFVEFVRAEEQVRAEIPDDSARAYAKRSYVIGKSQRAEPVDAE